MARKPAPPSASSRGWQGSRGRRAHRGAGALLQTQAEHHPWPLTEVGSRCVLQDEVHDPYPEQGETVVKGCSGDAELCCAAVESAGGKGEGVHRIPGKGGGKKWGAGCGQ